jgi:hypothetical protein
MIFCRLPNLRIRSVSSPVESGSLTENVWSIGFVGEFLRSLSMRPSIGNDPNEQNHKQWHQNCKTLPNIREPRKAMAVEPAGILYRCSWRIGDQRGHEWPVV